MAHCLFVYTLAPDCFDRRGEHRDAHLALAWAAADQAAPLFRGDTQAAAAFARAGRYVASGLVARCAVRPGNAAVGTAATQPVWPA